MRPDHAAIVAATPVGAALSYLLFAGDVDAGELIACSVVTVGASLYAFALFRSGSLGMRLAARGLTSLLRGSTAVVLDLGRVGWALLQAVGRRPEAVQGTIVSVPFRIGGLEPEDAGRRAAVVLAMSIAPNGFAVGVDQQRDLLLVHQLTPVAAGNDTEWPL
ncbi:MAG: hypothetical protein RQ966_13480 [Acetobacteraceae bacterium]|nr:hypothetical protein [Acetobacteraceae bacterium]